MHCCPSLRCPQVVQGPQKPLSGHASDVGGQRKSLRYLAHCRQLSGSAPNFQYDYGGGGGEWDNMSGWNKVSRKLWARTSVVQSAFQAEIHSARAFSRGHYHAELHSARAFSRGHYHAEMHRARAFSRGHCTVRIFTVRPKLTSPVRSPVSKDADSQHSTIRKWSAELAANRTALAPQLATSQRLRSER